MSPLVSRVGRQHVLVTNVVGPQDLPGIYDEIKNEVDMKSFVMLIAPKTDRALNWVNVRIR